MDEVPPGRFWTTAEATACDLFLAMRSSLKVYPAAGPQAIATQAGASLVIINSEHTYLGHLADLVINGEIGPTPEATLNW